MTVRVERDGRVTTVILSRPNVRNAVDPETAEALVRAFVAFDEDEGADVAVFFGDSGTFCSGADLKVHGGGAVERFQHTGVAPMGPSRMTLGKPVIGAIAGYAVAGGLELALWCDMRVVEEDAVMGVFCRRWGVPLVDGGTIRLPRLVGLGRALDLIMTGRSVSAEEALRIGLADRVVPKGTARQAAEALAHQIAAFPQVCMRNDRLSAHEQFGLTLEEAFKNEHGHGLRSLQAESIAGASRFAAGAGRHGAGT